MTNEYAAALAKEAECAFRATQQVVDHYHVIHAQALGWVLGCHPPTPPVVRRPAWPPDPLLRCPA